MCRKKQKRPFQAGHLKRFPDKNKLRRKTSFPGTRTKIPERRADAFSFSARSRHRKRSDAGLIYFKRKYREQGRLFRSFLRQSDCRRALSSAGTFPDVKPKKREKPSVQDVLPRFCAAVGLFFVGCFVVFRVFRVRFVLVFLVLFVFRFFRPEPEGIGNPVFDCVNCVPEVEECAGNIAAFPDDFGREIITETKPTVFRRYGEERDGVQLIDITEQRVGIRVFWNIAIINVENGCTSSAIVAIIS